MSLAVGEYRQLLGEVRVRDEARTGIFVRARLGISMDGVDCELYDRCMALRRRL